MLLNRVLWLLHLLHHIVVASKTLTTCILSLGGGSLAPVPPNYLDRTLMYITEKMLEGTQILSVTCHFNILKQLSYPHLNFF